MFGFFFLAIGITTIIVAVWHICFRDPSQRDLLSAITTHIPRTPESSSWVPHESSPIDSNIFSSYQIDTEIDQRSYNSVSISPDSVHDVPREIDSGSGGSGGSDDSVISDLML